MSDRHHNKNRGSKSPVSEPAETSCGNLLEMQILRPQPRPPESETWGWGSAMHVSTHPPEDSAALKRLKTTGGKKE